MTTRPYGELGDDVAAGALLVREDLQGDGVAAVMCSSAPNGVKPGVKGQIAVDVVSGLAWQNTDNGTTWVAFGAGGGSVTVDSSLIGDGSGTPLGVAQWQAGTLTPAALPAGVTNDLALALAGVFWLRVTADAAGSILTGLDAAGIADGKLVGFRNIGTGQLGLAYQSALSVAANRFSMGNGVGVGIAPNGAAVFRRDVLTDRWVLITATGTPAALRGFSSSTALAGGSSTDVMLPNVGASVNLSVSISGGDGTGVATLRGIDATLANEGQLLSLGFGSAGEMLQVTNLNPVTAGNGIATGTKDSATLQVTLNTRLLLLRDSSNWRLISISSPGNSFSTNIRTATSIGIGPTSDWTLGSAAPIVRWDAVRAQCSAAAVVTGLIAPPLAVCYRFPLWNISGFTLTLNHEDVLSVAGNRFLCPAAAPFVIPVNGLAWLMYDPTSLRWRVS